MQTQIEFVLVSTICATWTDLRRKYYWDQNLNMNTEQGQILIWETQPAEGYPEKYAVSRLTFKQF